MKDFLLFRTFMAHSLIRVFFYLSIILYTLTYFGMTIFAFFTQGIQQGLFTGVGGFFLLIFNFVLLRVFSEMMIIVFQIHDELKKLNQKMPSLDR